MEEISNKIQGLTEKLEEGVKEVLSSNRYKEYLSKMSKFHKYSYANTLLILLQNEKASFVAGFQAWQKLFHRTVNKGEKAIQIFAPCPIKIKQEIEDINEKGEKERKIEETIIPKFKVVNVFDVSQTSGEPLIQIAQELQGEYNKYDKMFKAIRDCSTYELIFSGDVESKGLCSVRNKKIIIKENMSEIQTIKTLLHEVAHEILHANSNDKNSRNKQEIEAESIAFVVSNYFGIDTSSYSFEYITTWQDKSKADIKSSLQTIQETSHHLISQISENLGLSKELSIEEKIESAKQIASNQITKTNIKDKSKNRNECL